MVKSLVDELLAGDSSSPEMQRRSGDSPVKIIDVYRSSRSQRQQADLESRANRNSAPNSGAHQQQQQQQQQQVQQAQSPQGNKTAAQGRQQKQQSGETLSSFESDYDLLVYLGETETEDIVDTERSLDYQDQTWRQSICGGASLAPTIDENLSELANQPAQPWDLELLGPPPVRSASKLGTLTSNRSLQVQRVSPRPQQVVTEATASATTNDDECDNEVSLVFEPSNRYQVANTQVTIRPPTASPPSTSNKSSTRLGDRLVSLFNRRLPNEQQQQQQVVAPINKSHTLGAKKPREMALSANDAAELDRLLAEMSQSLDLDALAKYDTTRIATNQPELRVGIGKQPAPATASQTLHKFTNDRQPARTIAAHLPTASPAIRADLRRPYTSMSKLASPNQPIPKLQPTTAASEASCESILDEYDGASRMLEQMISDQLHVRAKSSPITNPNSNVGRLFDHPKQLDTSGQVPLKRHQHHHQQKSTTSETTSELDSRNSPSKLSSTGSATGGRQAQPATSSKASVIRNEVGVNDGPTRKLSTDCSSLATTENSVVLAAPPIAPSVDPSRGHDMVSPKLTAKSVRRSPSPSSSNSSRLVPPSPPAVDYGDDQEVIRVEAAAPSSSDDDEPMAASGLPEHESQMGRMKRRTLSSMRSMRSKLTDLMAGKSGAQQPPVAAVAVARSQPAPPKRSSSIGSRGSIGASLEPAPVVIPTGSRPSRPAERHSRAKRRAPQPPSQQTSAEPPHQHQSFGQQIRERISRSKSRISRFLRPATKRAQSQPNTKQELVEATESSEGVRHQPLFEPGDIARNSELSASGTPAQPDSTLGLSSFDESLDRHIAARLNGTATVKQRTSSGASSGSSQLSGLDTRPSRDRRRRRQPSVGSSKTGNGKEPRSTSLLSIKRLSASLRHKATDVPADDAREDLDSMRVSARETPTSRRRRTANKSSDSELSQVSPVTTSRPPTTNDYFGQVAPARADSSDRDDSNRAAVRLRPLSTGPTINRSARSLNLEPPEVTGTSSDDASSGTKEEPRRPNRSLSMRSMRDETQPDSARCRLPAPTSTFRPVSACATLSVQSPAVDTEEPIPDDLRQLPATADGVKPVRPSNSPLPGYPPIIKSARPAQFEKRRGVAGSASPKRSLGERCRDLFVRPASPAALPKPARPDPPASRLETPPSSPQPGARNALVPYPPPKRPPRNRSKSITAGSSPEIGEDSTSGQVIEVSAASPGSSLDRNQVPLSQLPETSGNSNRLAALAQQIKHQAVDFFQGNSSSNHHHHQAANERNRSPRHIDLEEPEELVHWRPVITAADARRPKDDNLTEGPRSTASRLPRLAKQQQQQQSLDTDSTWESSGDEEEEDIDEGVRMRTKKADDSPADRQANQSALNKLAVRGKASLPAANSEGLCSVESAKLLDNDNHTSIELNNNNIIIDDDGGVKSNNKHRQQQVEPISSKFVPTDEPYRARGANKRLQSNISSVLAQHKQEQQVVDDVESSKAATAAEATGGAILRPDLHSSSKANNNSKSEQAEICKTTFEFNANLPSPAQLIKLHHQDQKPAQVTATEAGDAAGGEQHEALVESLVRGDSNLAALLNLTPTSTKKTEISASTTKSDTMAVIKQATGAPIGQVALLKPKQQQQTTQESQYSSSPDHSGKQDETTSDEAKRLSVYDNVDEQQVAAAKTTSSPARKPRERQWRRPPQPPKPAHLASMMKAKSALLTAAEQVPQIIADPQRPPDNLTSGEWAVDEDDDETQVRAPSPRRSPEVPSAQAAQPPVEPARPKPKLIAMTSIVHEPEDELMVGASSEPQPVDADPASSGTGTTPRLLRRDSTFSASFDFDTSTNNNNNNSDNSTTDSSFAAATASRKRLVSKFEAKAQSNEPRAPRPKFPAFAEGRGAGPSGNSLVRRLARNFDQQTPATQQPTGRPPLAAKPAGLTRPLTATSLTADEEPRSESSWYDAKANSELIDEDELAEFLRDFDRSPGGAASAAATSAVEQPVAADNKRLTLTELSRSLSEIGSVSTGADPFVTVAESTLEESASGVRAVAVDDGKVENNNDNGDDDGDDDTLNDDEQLAEETASYVVFNAAGDNDGDDDTRQQGGDNDLDDDERQRQQVAADSNTTEAVAELEPTGDRVAQKQSADEHAAKEDDHDDEQNKDSQVNPTRSYIDEPGTSEVITTVTNTPKETEQSRISPEQSREYPNELLEDSDNEDHDDQDDEDRPPVERAGTSKSNNSISSSSNQRLSRHLGMSERDDQVSLSSSSVSDETDYSEDFSESLPELRQRQNLQRLYHVVNEIYSSEAKFVDTLHLLNVDLRRHLERGQAPADCVDSLLRHLPQLQALNESLLSELKAARDLWPRQQKIAHVLVKIGPFLKHYSSYIREFETIQQQLQDNIRKHPASFGDLVRKFEASERAQRLSIQHHLLKPIQRIPQYRLLLQQYLQHLKPDDLDYEDTVLALEVVSRVAEHANQAMREGANFAKLLALQAKIVGKQRDIVQPGRLFVKEGELMKVCRKQVQPRWFVLLNDALLYLAAIQSSDILYLKNELPLDDCLVSSSEEGRPETEFSVCTRTRSFALIARSTQERDEWLSALRKTIDEHQARRRSFQVRNQQLARARSDYLAGGVSGELIGTDAANLSLTSLATELTPGAQLLGQRAPIWMPDSRATSCQLCTSGFSALFRRHHCRACGRVVCSACSANKAPLVYLKCRAARVCDQCFEQLKASLHLYYLPRGTCSQVPSLADEELRRLDEHFLTLLKSQFVRHANLRKLHRLARNTSGSKINRHSADANHLLPEKQEKHKEIDNNNHHHHNQQQQQQHHHHHHKRHVLCEVGAALVQLASSSSSSSLSATSKQQEKKKLNK